MALYAVLAKLTEMGAKNLKGMMERRPRNIEQLQKNGIQIVADYALMGGDYDFLYLVEAPDNETILRQIAQDTQSGQLKFYTMPATRLEEFARMVAATSGAGDERAAG